MTDTERAAGGAVLKALAPATLSLAVLWSFRDALGDVDPSRIAAALSTFAPWHWVLGLAATALTFWAYGRSEIAVHRWLGTGCAPRAASRSGMAALAISQVTGLGPLIGMLVRWRCDPAGGPGRAARVTALVSLSFLICLALLTALATLAFGSTIVPRPVAFAILAAGCLLLLLSCLSRNRTFARPLPVLGALLFSGTVDAAAASVAFWAFVPGAPYSDIAPAFLTALGAGLVSGLPGGLGSFDLCLQSFLPHDAQGATAAFRLVHFAAPATAAAIALVCLPRLFDLSDAQAATFIPGGGILGVRAEAGLARQPGMAVLTLGPVPRAVVWTAPHTLCAIGAPFAGDLPLDTLRESARGMGRNALIYKIGARDAARARRAGWSVTSIGTEAIIRLETFDLATPDHRQSRRKLKKAARSRLRIGPAHPGTLNALRPLDTAWQAARGGARGISMGRFDMDYLGQQVVIAAYDGAEPVAFASFHRARTEWTLDLLRWTADCPDGAMHALVAEGIARARSAGTRQVSLAAIPRFGATEGLRRFKQSFAPDWDPLYAAAPTRLAVWSGLADLGWDIARPPARTAAHNHVEGSAFAAGPVP